MKGYLIHTNCICCTQVASYIQCYNSLADLFADDFHRAVLDHWWIVEVDILDEGYGVRSNQNIDHQMIPEDSYVILKIITKNYY